MIVWEELGLPVPTALGSGNGETVVNESGLCHAFTLLEAAKDD